MRNLRQMVAGNCRCRDRQSGGILIEVLIAIAIMAVIVGPLTAAFMTFLRAGPAVRGDLDRSADARRIGWAWTRDVQNVEPGGVNNGHCANPSFSDINLVSFTWNSSPDAVAAGELPITSSWVAVGTGDDLQLVRRQCSGETLVSEDVLARHVGINGDPITTTVHGPNAASPTDFCPVQDLGGGSFLADTCSIEIDGSFTYGLTVTRRVADRTGEPNALPPSPPTITGATGRNEYLVVAWTPPTVATGQPPISGYRVLAYTDPSGPAVATAEVDGGSNSADVPGVTNGTAYWVRMQARNSAGWGELSAPFGAITPNPTTPDAGAVLSVEPLNGQVSVTWSPPLNNGGLAITEWRIYAKSGSDPEIGPTVITPGGSTTGVIAGLTNGTSYTITVAAVNGLGEGVRSDPSSPVVPYGPSDPPTAVVAKANEAKAKVRWTPPANSNGRPIVGYTISTFQGQNQSTETASVYKTLAEAACATTCEFDVPVANADYYRFAVRARTDVGDGVTLEGTSSGLSAVLDSQYGPLVFADHVRPSVAPNTPGQPSLSVATGTNAGTYKLNVTLVLPVDNGANAHSIKVEYQRAPTSSPSSWTTQGTVTEATSGAAGASKVVSIDNVANAFHYRARVQVANRGEWTNSGDRWSPWSAYSGSVVGPGAPGMPTSVVVSRPSGSFGTALNLSYVAPADTGGSAITAYNISCTAPSGNTVTSTQTTAGTKSLTGFRDGRNYSCTVTATNAAGYTSPAGSTSSTAMPYGECRLKSDLTHHIKEGSGAQTNRDNFWVRQSTWASNGEAGLIRFTWTNTCVGVSSAMPTGSYTSSAAFYANIDDARNRSHKLQRLTGSWSTSSTWSGPSGTTVGSSWCANSTGWKQASGSSVLTAVQEMRAGTNNFGFAIRDNGGGCGATTDFNASARYRGSNQADGPYLYLTFYTQGA